MITLQQVAHAAGCRLATVLYALRDDPRIRPETRTLVQKVAAQLGYRPNPRFAALMSHIRNSRAVGGTRDAARRSVHDASGQTGRRSGIATLKLRVRSDV